MPPGTTDAQMRACRDSVAHLLSAKPEGAFLTNPYDVLDKFLERKPIITCGNNVWGSNGVPTTTNPGYPMLGKTSEGGGGSYTSPWAYAEDTGFCKYKAGDAVNPNLSGDYGSEGADCMIFVRSEYAYTDRHSLRW